MEILNFIDYVLEKYRGGQMENLIKRLSSMINRTGLFSRKRLAMNETAAREIQKLVFEKRTSKKGTNTNPPYKKIVSQLDDKHDQIFEGAVFYLTKIAKSSAKYREEIRNILEQHLEKPHLSAKRKEYINNKLSEMKKLR